MPLFSTGVAGWKDHATRRVQFKSPYSGDGALACRGALSCVQVRVKPCGARGGADTLLSGTEQRES